MNTNHAYPGQQPITRRRFLQLASSATTVTLLSACAPVAPAAQPQAANSSVTTPKATTPQRGGVLRMVPPDSLSTLDIGLSGVSGADSALGLILYEGLTRRSEGEEGAPLYPQLAESWEISEDMRIWTFHLRKGVTFHHGTPFTAKDVEYSINRILDPALGSTFAANLSFVERVEVVDDFTVRIHAKTPNVAVPYFFGAYIQMVPHDRTSEQLAKQPSGTGAFKLAEYVPGERVVLKRNENYWKKDLPYLDEVQMIFIPEPVAQIAALTSGTADLIMQVSIENLAQLKSDANSQILESKQRLLHVFNMHVTEKPFDDVRVRQAFKHALDREALRKLILGNRGDIGNDQPVAPNSPFWANVPPLAHDVEKAKQLLAAAGYANGLAVTLAVADISPRIVDAAVAIQEMVKPAGITLTIDKAPADTYWTDKYLKTPFFVSWWPTYSDLEGILPVAYATGSYYNESGWSDPKLDQLIAQARAEGDLATRKKLYAEAQQMISVQGAVLVPYFMPFLQAVRSNVQGVIPGELLHPEFMWLAQG